MNENNCPYCNELIEDSMNIDQIKHKECLRAAFSQVTLRGKD